MPFFGVLKERSGLFVPQPEADVGVSDGQAWRLNPAHRFVYDKLALARGQGLRAAPLGVDPRAFGFADSDWVFVKPMVNLSGMSLGAGAFVVSDLPLRPGSFWSELLTGDAVSTDALVLDGRVLWMAHSVPSEELVRLQGQPARPLFWQVGVDCAELEPRLVALLEARLRGYSGLCNVETIGGVAIEMHLRGSNAFFDFYGEGFMRAWVDLVDAGRWSGLAAVAGGVLASVFVDPNKLGGLERAANEAGVGFQRDDLGWAAGTGRSALLRGVQPEVVKALARRFAPKGEV